VRAGNTPYPSPSCLPPLTPLGRRRRRVRGKKLIINNK